MIGAPEPDVLGCGIDSAAREPEPVDRADEIPAAGSLPAVPRKRDAAAMLSARPTHTVSIPLLTVGLLAGSCTMDEEDDVSARSLIEEEAADLLDDDPELVAAVDRGEQARRGDGAEAGTTID